MVSTFFLCLSFACGFGACAVVSCIVIDYAKKEAFKAGAMAGIERACERVAAAAQKGSAS